MTNILIKRDHLNTETHILEEHHGRMTTEVKVKLLRGKECPRLPALHQKLTDKYGHLLSHRVPSVEISPANTLILDFKPPEFEAKKYCCLSHSACKTL